jgi:hypothetical protein
LTIIYRGKRLFVELKSVDLPNGRTKETIIVHPGVLLRCSPAMAMTVT